MSELERSEHCISPFLPLYYYYFFPNLRKTTIYKKKRVNTENIFLSGYILKNIINYIISLYLPFRKEVPFYFVFLTVIST